MPRNGNRTVLNQGNSPTCGPTSCGMVLDTLGNPIDVSQLVKQLKIGKNGVTIDKLEGLLKSHGVKAQYRSKLTIEALAESTAKGKPAVVAVRQGGGGHAIVVDGITTRQGVDVVAIRDPWGEQFFERLDVFKKRYMRQGVVIKSD